MAGVPVSLMFGQNLNVQATTATVCTSAPATIWVVDSGNNRILEFTAPFTSGMSATLVIGQPDFVSSRSGTTASSLNSPNAIAFDSSGNLWVADTGNSRILRFSPPFTSGMSASLVLGQLDFTHGSTNQGNDGSYGGGSWGGWGGGGHHGGDEDGRDTRNPTAKSEAWPMSIAFDPAGNLWVADNANSRILMYASPFSTAESASLVLGQADFTHGHQNGGYSSAHDNNQNSPATILFDSSGNLWVSDSGNNRVLEYVPPFSNGMKASIAIGQSSLFRNTATTTQMGLAYPNGMAFDASGNLWVSDQGNNRILEFLPPFSTGMPANLVIGQSSSFTTGSPEHNQDRTSAPGALGFDSSGTLWTADYSNNRVLAYAPPLWGGSITSTVIGQPTNFEDNTVRTTQNGLNGPIGLALTGPGTVCTSASVQDSGTVTGATSTTLVDSTKSWTVNLWINYVITIVGGTGVGQTSIVASNTGNTLTVTTAWTTTPDTTSKYTLTYPVCSSLGGLRYTLVWLKQIDPVGQSTIFITSAPQDSFLSHAFVALSSAPSIYVVRLTDGTVLYHSQSYNVRGSQYGIIPNQQFTLSGVGIPVAVVGNSYNIAWLTTSGASPTPAWLHVAQVPVNQAMAGTATYQAISLSNLVDPKSGLTASLNPVSLLYTPDGSWIILGATSGYVAAFSRGC